MPYLFTARNFCNRNMRATVRVLNVLLHKLDEKSNCGYYILDGTPFVIWKKGNVEDHFTATTIVAN